MATIKLPHNGVDKMFPVSFERQGHYDRVLSEENLVDWFRGLTSNSANSVKNSDYSYVITETLSENFGNGTVKSYLEFILGGYYVRLTDDAVSNISAEQETCDLYAVIYEISDNSLFRHLAGGDINSEDNFTAMELHLVGHGEALDFSTETRRYFKLHILSREDGKYSIPNDSKKASSAVDGGEID